MFRFKTLAALGFLAVLFAFAPVTSYGQKAQPSPTPGPSNVNVVNTPNVNVTSLPSVTLAPDSKVGIDPANNSVKVAPGGEMFFRDSDIHFGNALFADSEEYTVPEGKRLVIEHVSTRAGLNTGERLTNASIKIDKPDGTTYGFHFLPSPAGVSANPASAYVFFNISQPLRMYLDAGYSYTCRLSRNVINGNAVASCTVSGYLVDAQ